MDRSAWLEGKYKYTDRSMRQQLRYVGRRHYNPDRLINSALGDKILEVNSFWYLTNFAEDAPEVMDFWKKAGIKKEIHHADDYMAKLSAHLPLEACENKGKKYPVIFQLHGGASPIFDAEFYGFSQLGAKEGFITVYPQDRAEETIRKIWQEVQELYPVDPSRVYVTGFSEGGVRCHDISSRCTDIFAACAPCGVHVMANYDGLPAEFDEIILKNGMPTVHIFGEEEAQNIEPYSVVAMKDNSQYMLEISERVKADVASGKIRERIKGGGAKSGEEKLDIFNRRLRVSGLEEVSYEDCLKALKNERNPVEEKLGIPCKESKVVVRYDKEHYIADFRSKDGVVIFRTCCIQDVPHWCNYDEAEVAWNFLSRFSRDPATKELKYDGSVELF